jgi:hypothetical protein
MCHICVNTAGLHASAAMQWTPHGIGGRGSGPQALLGGRRAAGRAARGGKEGGGGYIQARVPPGPVRRSGVGRIDPPQAATPCMVHGPCP